MSQRDAILNIQAKDNASATLRDIGSALERTHKGVKDFASGLTSLNGPIAQGSAGYKKLLEAFGANSRTSMGSAEAAMRGISSAIDTMRAKISQTEGAVSRQRQTYANLKAQAKSAETAFVELNRQMYAAPKGSAQRARLEELVNAARAGQQTIQAEMDRTSNSMRKSGAELSKYQDRFRQLSQQAGIAASQLRDLKVGDLSGFGAIQRRILDLNTGISTTGKAIRDAEREATRLGQAMAATPNPGKQLIADFDRARAVLKTLRAEQHALASERGNLSNTLNRSSVDRARIAGDTRIFGNQTSGFDRRRIEVDLDTSAAHRKLRELGRVGQDAMARAVKLEATAGYSARTYGAGSDQHIAARRAAAGAISAQDVDHARKAYDGYAESVRKSSKAVSDGRSALEASVSTRAALTAQIERQQRATESADRKARKTGLEADMAKLLAEKTALEGLLTSREKLEAQHNQMVAAMVREEAQLASLTALRDRAKANANALASTRARLDLGAVTATPQSAQAEIARVQGEIARLTSMKNQVAASISSGTAQPGSRKALTEINAELTSLQSRLTAVRDAAPALRLLNFRDVVRQMLGLTSAADQAAGAVNRLGGAPMRNLRAGADQARSGLGGLGNELKSLIVGFAGVYGVISQGKEIVNVFRNIQSAESRMGHVFGRDMERVGDEMRYLREQADRFGLSLPTMTKDYTKFMAAASGAGVANEDTRALFEGMASAGRVYNMTADEMNRAFNSISQMLSKNQVMAEELKGQLAEAGLSGAVTMFAKAMGYGVDEMDKFYKAMEAGKFKAADVVKFGKYLGDSFKDSADAASQTFEAQLNRFSNSIFEAREKIAKGGLMDGLTDSMKQLQTFFESEEGHAFFIKIGQGAGIALSAFATLAQHADKLIIALASFFGGRILTAGVARVATAFTGLGAAIAGQAVATAGSTAAMAANTAVLTRGGRAAAAAAVAFRGLLTVLGGPIGVAITAAATAFSVGQSRSAKAAAQSQRAIEAVNETVSKSREAFRSAKGDADAYAKSLDAIGKARINQAVLDAEEQYDRAGANAISRVMAREIKAETSWWNPLDAIRKKRITAEIARGDNELANWLSEMSLGLKEGTVEVKDFIDQIDALQERGSISQESAAAYQQYALAAKARAVNLKALRLDQQMVNATGADQTRIFKQISSNMAQADGEAKSLASTYAKLLGTMARLDKEGGRFRIAHELSETLAKISEDAKSAREDLEALTDLSVGEKAARIQQLDETVRAAEEQARIDAIEGMLDAQGVNVKLDRKSLDELKRAGKGLVIDLGTGVETTLDGMISRLEVIASQIASGGDVVAGLDKAGMISSAGDADVRSFFAKEEAVRNKAYWDAAGKVWTIGVGHTGAAGGIQPKEGMTLTDEQVWGQFDRDIALFQRIIDEKVKVPLTKAMNTALLSYAFNTGKITDGILRPLNTGDYAGAQDGLRNGINTAKGKFNPVLHARRGREADLFGSQGLAPGSDFRIEARATQIATIAATEAASAVARGTKADPAVAITPNAEALDIYKRVEALAPKMADEAMRRLQGGVLQAPELLSNPTFLKELKDGNIEGVIQGFREAGLKESADDLAQAARRDILLKQDDKLATAVLDYNKSLETVKGELSSRDLLDAEVFARAIATEVDRISREAGESGYSLEQLTGLSKDASLAEIRSAVEKAADLEKARQARTKLEKDADKQRDFGKENGELLRAADFDIKIAELTKAAEDARRGGDADRARAVEAEIARAQVLEDIRKREESSGVKMSEADKQAQVDRAMRLHGIEAATTLEKDKQDRIEQQLSSRQAERERLMSRLEEAREDGDRNAELGIVSQLDDVNRELERAIGNAIAFWQAIGGPEAGDRVAELEHLRHEIDRGGVAASDYRDSIQSFGDMLTGHISGAIQQFAQDIASGENAFKSLGRAVATAVGQILVDIGMMIVKAVVARMVLAALGIHAPMGSAGGNVITSLMTGQGLGGIHHDGGIAGDMKGMSAKDFLQRALNPKPNERLSLLLKGEEVLTEDDPRHRNNSIGAMLRKGVMKYHTGGISGRNADNLSANLRAAQEGSKRVSAALDGAASGGNGGVGDVKIVNAFDPASFFSEGLSTAAGQRAFLNFVSANGAQLKALMG